VALEHGRAGREVVGLMESLRPLFDQVVVQELKPDEQQRSSGLVVPATRAEARMPPQEGVVVAVGPGLDWWSGAGIEMPIKPGDKVMFPYTAGVYVEVGEQKLLVMRVGMILGVVEDAAREAEERIRAERDWQNGIDGP
jgi:chaperonin GroES